MALAKQIVLAVENDADYYDPIADGQSEENQAENKPKYQTGKRKEWETVSIRLQFNWPKGDKSGDQHSARMSLFRTWHECAFKRATAKNYVPAIIVLGQIWRHFNVRDTIAWAGDELMASAAGVSEKTISRGVKFLCDTGFLDRRYEYKIDRKTKKLTKLRILHFTVPEAFPIPIILSNLEDDLMDNRGPNEPEVLADHDSPKNKDNRGPVTVEGIVEKGQADAA